MNIRTQLLIDAPVETVFDFVTRIDNYEKYIPGTAGEILEGSDGQVGMTFRWTTKWCGMRIPAVETVTEREDDSFIRYRGRTLGLPFRTEMRTEPHGGGTRLSIRIEYDSGLRAANLAVAPLLRHQAAASARAVKRLLELDNTDQVQRTYGFWGRSGLYGASTFLTFLGREGTLRRRAVDRLELRPGGSALDLCCGTGRNHPHLRRVVGADGHITGVDLTAAMLDVARRNDPHVELIQADVTRVELPAESYDGVIATLGLSVVPDYERAIARAVQSLRPGGRMVICDAVPFHGAARIVNPAVEWIYRAGAVWNPDADLIGALERHTENVEVEWANGGSFYIASGTRKKNGAP